MIFALPLALDHLGSFWDARTMGWSRVPDAVPDAAVPDVAVPDVVVPDVAVPDVAVPDVAVPDVVVPDVVVPDVVVPARAERVADLLSRYLAAELRTGRLMEHPITGGAGPDEADLDSRLLRVSFRLRDGELDGLMHPLGLASLPPVPLAGAIGVVGRGVPGPSDHAAQLRGLAEHLEWFEEAALTRESWLLLAERAEEVSETAAPGS